MLPSQELLTLLILLMLLPSEELLTLLGLMTTYIIEGDVKFQLEVTKNKDIIFSPSKFMEPPEFHPQILG